MASGRGLYLIKLVGPKPSKCLWLGDRLDRAVPSTENPDTVLVHIYRRGARTVRGGGASFGRVLRVFLWVGSTTSWDVEAPISSVNLLSFLGFLHWRAEREI